MKLYQILPGAFALCVASMTLMSCSTEDPLDGPLPENATSALSMLSYNDGVWAKVNENQNFSLNGVSFSHYISEWGTVEGFTPAILDENVINEPYYEQQFNIMPTGNSVDNPYIVAFWSSFEGTAFTERSLRINTTVNGAFTPMEMKVTNTAYAYYTMVNGNDFSKPFGNNDWFKIIAHGVKADASETTAEFYLAKDGTIYNDWQTFDLKSLGEVVGIYFTMESSDTGEWGMNTPSYFAFKDFYVAY